MLAGPISSRSIRFPPPPPLWPIACDLRRGCCTPGCLLRLPGLFPAQSQITGQLRALSGVIGRNHRVVPRQTPLLAVLLGGQPPTREVSLQTLVPSAVLKTDQVVRRNRLLDRNGRCRLLHILLSGFAEALERSMHIRDEGRQICRA